MSSIPNRANVVSHKLILPGKMEKLEIPEFPDFPGTLLPLLPFTQ